jgi:hypothetical protein
LAVNELKNYCGKVIGEILPFFKMILALKFFGEASLWGER